MSTKIKLNSDIAFFFADLRLIQSLQYFKSFFIVKAVDIVQPVHDLN